MRAGRRLLWGIAAIVIIIAVVFAFDLTPWVRGGFGWRWEYNPLPLPSWLLPAVLLFAYIAGAFVLLRRAAATRWLLLWSIMFCVGLAAAVTAAHEGDAIYGLFARTVSKLATGPYWLAAHVDWANGEWRQWTTVMRDAGGHLSNLPPGLPMGYALLADILETFRGETQLIYDRLFPYQCHNFEVMSYPQPVVSSALFGVLMPLWAAFSVLPIAVVARRLSGEQAARWAILWWPLTPALMAFAGSMNTMFPLLTLTALWLLLRALDATTGWRLGWAVAAGLVTGLATFANFAFAPLPLIFGLLTLFYGLGVKKSPFVRLVLIGIAFGVGVLVPWGLFAAATGLTPLDLLRASFEFHLDLDRPYTFWAFMHVWDWLVWGGLGLTVLALFSAFRTRRSPEGSTALSAALVLGMLLLTLSGTARGETGRVWLVFTPLLVVCAADGLRRLTSDRATSWTVIAVANGVLALVLVMSIPVVGIDLQPPPTLDTTIAARPIEGHFVDRFQTVFRLQAWDAVQHGDILDLSLTFTPIQPARQPYYLGGVLVIPGGPDIPAEAQQPTDAAGRMVPATCWRPDSPVTVHMTQAIPDGFVTDNAYFSLAIYGAEAGSGPLQVIAADMQIGLGPIAIAR